MSDDRLGPIGQPIIYSDRTRTKAKWPSLVWWLVDYEYWAIETKSAQCVKGISELRKAIDRQETQIAEYQRAKNFEDENVNLRLNRLAETAIANQMFNVKDFSPELMLELQATLESAKNSDQCATFLRMFTTRLNNVRDQLKKYEEFYIRIQSIQSSQDIRYILDGMNAGMNFNDVTRRVIAETDKLNAHLENTNMDEGLADMRDTDIINHQTNTMMDTITDKLNQMLMQHLPTPPKHASKIKMAEQRDRY